MPLSTENLGHRLWKIKAVTEDTACLGAPLFALEFKSRFPKETTQKMVRSPSHSSNLFNAYLVKPQ